MWLRKYDLAGYKNIWNIEGQGREKWKKMKLNNEKIIGGRVEKGVRKNSKKKKEKEG